MYRRRRVREWCTRRPTLARQVNHAHYRHVNSADKSILLLFHLVFMCVQDDYRICLREGIVTKESKPVCPVDASGKFTAEVTDFFGQYVKDADRGICQHLKRLGRLIQQSTVQHSYPFCWRYVLFYSL